MELELQGGRPIGKPADPKPLATFEASIPPIKSAIISGNDGHQVKIEIPKSSMAGAIDLITKCQGKALHVVVFADGRTPQERHEPDPQDEPDTLLT